VKEVHLIRHGESEFNAAFALKRVDPMIFDAPLTPRGHEQAALLRPEVTALGVETVIISPLTRAIQTALGAFGGCSAKLVIEALHRERVEHSGDLGRSPRVLATEFPNLAFDHLDDPWWHCEAHQPQVIVIEPEDSVLSRVQRFREFLARRPERRIAVVGHGTFLRHLTGFSFANCERRTITL
jgi:broad specificity phosphatase PhoE